MTLEDKTLLRFAMRHLSKAQRSINEFNFKVAKDELDIGYGQIQKLSIVVKMNGEDTDNED